MSRTSHMQKQYVYEDGSVSRSAKPGWAAIRFNLFGAERETDATGKERPVIVDTFSVNRADIPESVAELALGHGLMQKLGDSVSDVVRTTEKEGEKPHPKRGYADHIKATLSALWDDIAQGFWVEEGEGGSGGVNVTLLMKAVLAAFEAQGTPLPEEKLPALKEKLSTKEGREAYAKNPHVAKHLAELKAAAAAERAKRAAEAANKVEAELAIDF